MVNQDDTMSTAKDRATEVAQEAQNKADNVAQEAKAQASQVAETARQEAKDLAKSAEGQARSALSDQKEQAAHELDSVAQAFRTTGQQLRQQEQTALADYSRQIASQVESFSGYIQNRTIDDMLTDAEDFARNQPELFVGGAFALGILAARFFKSSSETRRGGGRQRYGSSQFASDRDYGTVDYEIRERPRPLPEQDASREARMRPREELDWE